MEKIYKKLCTKINLYEVTNLPYVLWNEFLPWERSNRQEFLRLFPLGKSRGAWVAWSVKRLTRSQCREFKPRDGAYLNK